MGPAEPAAPAPGNRQGWFKAAGTPSRTPPGTREARWRKSGAPVVAILLGDGEGDRAGHSPQRRNSFPEQPCHPVYGRRWRATDETSAQGSAGAAARPGPQVPRVKFRVTPGRVKRQLDGIPRRRGRTGGRARFTTVLLLILHVVESSLFWVVRHVLETRHARGHGARVTREAPRPALCISRSPNGPTRQRDIAYAAGHRFKGPQAWPSPAPHELGLCPFHSRRLLALDEH